MDEIELKNPTNTPEDVDYSGFKIRERYVEVLDLTKASTNEKVLHEICAKTSFTKIHIESNTKKTPSITTQKLELIGQPLAKSNTKKQNITDVIAKRIVRNHIEVPNGRKTMEPQLSSNSHLTRDVLNDIIIKRILEVDAKVNKKKQTFMLKADNTKSNKPPSTPNRRNIRKRPDTINNNLEKSISYATTNKKCKIKSATAAAQTNKERGETDCTQTDVNSCLREALVQVDPHNDSKNTQTGTETNNTETTTSENIATKFTNTEFYYPAVNETTQFFEYMSSSDLFCLEWVNKHLFDMTLSPYTIVVDDKIREISEVVTKSSFLTDVENRRELLAMDYI